MHFPKAEHPIFIAIDWIEQTLQSFERLRDKIRAQFRIRSSPAFRLTAVLLVISISVFGAHTASARHLDGFPYGVGSETRATIGISFTLGGNDKRTQAQPRIELALHSRRYADDLDAPFRTDADSVDQPLEVTTKFGLTLGDRPELSINDLSIATFGPQLHADEQKDDDEGGLSTVAVVGIGVAVLTVGTVLAGLATRDSLRDTLNPR